MFEHVATILRILHAAKSWSVTKLNCVCLVRDDEVPERPHPHHDVSADEGTRSLLN